MNNNIRPSKRLSIFKSYFEISQEYLQMLQKNLQPTEFLEIYEELKQERDEIMHSNRPLNSFNKHNKFRRIYQKELEDDYDSKESTLD